MCQFVWWTLSWIYFSEQLYQEFFRTFEVLLSWSRPFQLHLPLQIISQLLQGFCLLKCSNLSSRDKKIEWKQPNEELVRRTRQVGKPILKYIPLQFQEQLLPLVLLKSKMWQSRTIPLRASYLLHFKTLLLFLRISKSVKVSPC